MAARRWAHEVGERRGTCELTELKTGFVVFRAYVGTRVFENGAGVREVLWGAPGPDIIYIMMIEIER